MAPARSSTRRGVHPSPGQSTPPVQGTEDDDPNVNKELFLDPMLGTPLAIYVEKDVEDKETISQLIIKHGGIVSPGYSGVIYILVDPHKPSGQNLWRQYAGKKGKIILSANWVHECVKANQLQTFQSNWAGCKVTGTETIYTPPTSQLPEENTAPVNAPIQTLHAHAIQATMPPVADPIHPYPFQMYAPPLPPVPQRVMPPGQAPPWQVTVAPAQTHLHEVPPPPPTHHIIRSTPPPPTHSQPPSQHYREDAWDGYNTPDDMTAQPAAYDYRYREEQNNWVAAGPGPYYEPSYVQGYAQPPYMEDPSTQPSGSTSVISPPTQMAGPSAPPPPSAEASERPRGRKRTRTQESSSSFPNTPTRVIKSTYGGNLFTADDVLYLKKYIDYCQDQCLVLSLREICERIAVKSVTDSAYRRFYSWRRYCNKHQIRLGYGMDMEPDVQRVSSGAAVRLDMGAATAAALTASQRTRSPTPPRALYRSTTGKGVAFTQEDVNFLMSFLEYRKSQGALDMVVFWKDVAAKAPHHSRASWMKFWRRHKHELSPENGDEPLPAPPDKKMRYSKEDDVLLAKYFYNKPDGTSDKVFQAFGRLHPHHPWKGWQEHYRIHKTKIEHLMQLLAAGENIDHLGMDES
ncbi:hypothetical protein CPB84DRAFT_1795712 [Gymnopilus junonius]|uniref:BRCT domain-containing protein n=1 Tax=Gymnopilus junonius TaxID=109634 RepID=A0A9P5N9L7_GYMJU|nr:hypothetical protein CPB84DRAFT_1795712 [Gymnopilus junonius]